MNQINQSYFLRSHVLHIKGGFNDALYDTSSGAVYSLTGKAKEIINNISLSQYKEENNNISFIKKLESLELIICATKKPKPIIINKKPLVLKQMWLSLNSNCNLKCVHCYADSKPKASDFSLSDKVIFDAVRDGIKFYKLEFVQFIGGEPLLLDIKRLRHLISGIKEIGIEEIEIYTNAILITDKHIELFKEFNVHIAVSIYSDNAVQHDAITLKKGSWKKTISNVDLLYNNGIKLRFGIVAMNKNNKIIEKVKPWLIERYDKNVIVGVDVTRTCGRGNNINTVPWKRFKEVHIRKDNKRFMPATLETLQTTLYNNICWGGLVCIHPNGDVSPCEMEFNTIQGNINNSSLHEIITSKNDIAQRLSKDKIDICKQCEYRYVCWECRAMSNVLNKKTNSKPPTCMYNPLNGTWQDIPSKSEFFKPANLNEDKISLESIRKEKCDEKIRAI